MERRWKVQQEGGATPPDQASLRSMEVLGLNACILHGSLHLGSLHRTENLSRWKLPAPPPSAPPPTPAPGPDEASTSSHARTSRTHALTHACTCIHTYSQTHAYTHARTHTRTHTHTNTRTHTCRVPASHSWPEWPLG